MLGSAALSSSSMYTLWTYIFMFETLFVNGQLLSCGRNQYGQLGVGDRVDKDVPWTLAFGPYSDTVSQTFKTLAALSKRWTASIFRCASSIFLRSLFYLVRFVCSMCSLQSRIRLCVCFEERDNCVKLDTTDFSCNTPFWNYNWCQLYFLAWKQSASLAMSQTEASRELMCTSDHRWSDRQEHIALLWLPKGLFMGGDRRQSQRGFLEWYSSYCDSFVTCITINLRSLCVTEVTSTSVWHTLRLSHRTRIFVTCITLNLRRLCNWSH